MPVYGFDNPDVVRKLLSLVGASPQSITHIRESSERQFREGQWVPLVENTSGETVPAYAPMAIAGPSTTFADGRTFKIVKPATDRFRPIVFNGPHTIAAGSRGVFFDSGIVRAKYASGQSFNFGRVLGVDGWELKTTGRRFAQLTAVGQVDTTNLIALVEFAPLASEFEIDMTQTGGSDGDATTAPSWTYTVSDAFTGAQIATSVNPVNSPHSFKRLAAGKTEIASPSYTSKATKGRARYDSDGALNVVWCNERFAVRSC